MCFSIITTIFLKGHVNFMKKSLLIFLLFLHAITSLVAKEEDGNPPIILSVSPGDDSIVSHDELNVTIAYKDLSGIDIEKSVVLIDGKLLEAYPQPCENREVRVTLFHPNEQYFITKRCFIEYRLKEGDKLHKAQNTLFISLVNNDGLVTNKELYYGIADEFIKDIELPTSTISPPPGIYQKGDDLLLKIRTATPHAKIYFSRNNSSADAFIQLTSNSAYKITTDTIVYYYAEDKEGNREQVKQASYRFLEDAEVPEILADSVGPFDGAVIAADINGVLTLDYRANTAVEKIELLDSSGNRVPNTMTNNNHIVLELVNPQERLYSYTLKITELSGATIIYDYSFTVDNSKPVVVVDKVGGSYPGISSMFVTLSSSPGDTIYYTTNGDEPYERTEVGLSSTRKAISPASNVYISFTAGVENDIQLLKYFAIDKAGNSSDIQLQIYRNSAAAGEASSILIDSLDSNSESITIGFENSDLKRLFVYRCDNAVDYKIMLERIQNKLPLPDRFLITSKEGIYNSSSFVDNHISAGSQYWYAIATGIEDSEAYKTYPIENANAYSIFAKYPEGFVSDSDTLIKSAVSYLKGLQNDNGSWGDKKISQDIVASSMVLSTFKHAEKSFERLLPYEGTFKGLAYLHAIYADNNIFLAKKIKALQAYGHETSALERRLYNFASFSATPESSRLLGWGVQRHLLPDTWATLLALDAIQSIALNREALQPQHYYHANSRYIYRKDYLRAYAYHLYPDSLNSWKERFDDRIPYLRLYDAAMIARYVPLNPEIKSEANEYLRNKLYDLIKSKDSDVFLIAIIVDSLLFMKEY
jgi:hypothetical protein